MNKSAIEIMRTVSAVVQAHSKQLEGLFRIVGTQQQMIDILSGGDGVEPDALRDLGAQSVQDLAEIAELNRLHGLEGEN